MKKKLLALVLVVVLGISSVVGGTLAYLTDTGSDVNVMTLGNVDIEQHEYQRATNDDGSYKTNTIDDKNSYVLEAFEQGKPLLPATDPTNHGAGNWDSTTVRMSQVNSYGGAQVFANPNAQDKFVTVENTGKTDAYVRTLVAIENGTGDASLIGVGTRCVPAEDAENSTAPWVSNTIGKITVDGNTYSLFEYIYRGASDVNRHVNGVLPAGDTTYPSLCQVYLKSAATNEDCEKLDGNDNGTLDILVFSQAVQADGFADATTALDAAFGDITTANHPWVNGVKIPVTVATADELEKAIAEGGNIVLGSDIEVTGMVEVPVNGSASIDGQGYTLTRADSYTGTILSLGEYAELALSNITLDGENVESSGNLIYIDSFGKLTLNEGTVLENHVGGTTYDSARGPENSVIHCDGATTIVMNDGSVIQNNVGKGNFATVIASMYDLTCELNGGKIINNTSEKNNYTVNFGNYANVTVSDGFEAYGNTDGGLMRVNQQSTFTMNGGKLDGNGKAAIYTWVAKYVTLNGGEIIGNVYLNYAPATVGGTDVDGRIQKDKEVTKWALNLTPDFGTVRYYIEGNITQLNIVPAEGYTYVEGDESKLICENTGYETYWDAESGCFKVQASE